MFEVFFSLLPGSWAEPPMRNSDTMLSGWTARVRRFRSVKPIRRTLPDARTAPESRCGPAGRSGRLVAARVLGRAADAELGHDAERLDRGAVLRDRCRVIGGEGTRRTPRTSTPNWSSPSRISASTGSGATSCRGRRGRGAEEALDEDPVGDVDGPGRADIGVAGAAVDVTRSAARRCSARRRRSASGSPSAGA
jgi:hypothetical protein